MRRKQEHGDKIKAEEAKAFERRRLTAAEEPYALAEIEEASRQKTTPPVEIANWEYQESI